MKEYVISIVNAIYNFKEHHFSKCSPREVAAACIRFYRLPIAYLLLSADSYSSILSVACNKNRCIHLFSF